MTNIRDENAVAILEIVNLDLRGRVLEGATAYGWAVLNVFSEQPPTQSPVYKGSARLLTKGFANG
jgi:hypothetical protein